MEGDDLHPPPHHHHPLPSSSLYSKTKSMLNLGSFRSNPSFGSLAEESEAGFEDIEDMEEAEDEYEEEERRELERLRRRRRQSEHFSFGVKPPEGSKPQ